MENKLNIRKESGGPEQRIFLEGRLDAGWAGHLDDYLDSLVREGSYRFILNMASVTYLSSAGIRILLSQHKKINKIGGEFVLEDLSDIVSGVLEMVGMKSLLTQGKQVAAQVKKVESHSQDIKGYRFVNEILADERMTVSFAGNPALALNSGFTAIDNQKITFKAGHYSLGIGAIGEGFEDCKSRYGEYLALGDAIVYKPSDGSKVPDFAIKTGRFEPEINALCSLDGMGAFSNLVSFEPVELNTSITLEDLTEGIAKISGQEQFVFLLIAESAGLVGVSLSAPPVDGKQLFEFPGIRESINFTTEPAYSSMLTISLGFYSLHPDEPLKSFLRQAGPGSSAFMHTHTVIFPYQALPKHEISANKLVLQLFENSIARDVLHLVHDSRDIDGLGDSAFKQGVAWVGKFS